MDLNELNLDATDTAALQKVLTPRLTKYVPWDPTPKQRAFLLMNSVREILYGGAAGGGKSVVQLMGALQFVDVPGYNALLIRKTYADLIQPDALMDMAKKWLMPFVETGEVSWIDKEKKFTFPSTAILKFGYLESDNDKYQYQGAQYQYIGVDECTQIVPSGYRYLHSRLRKPKNLHVPLRFRATANPGGEYGEFYYDRFFGDGRGNRIFMGANLDDNPYLDKEEYIESLNELDPITREQLLNGNWHIKANGDMFSSSWFTTVSTAHVSSLAKRIRYWDMASTDPSKRKNKKDKREPDWTVGFKLAHHQGIYWIEDIVRVQMTPAEVERLVLQTARLDGRTTVIRMEQEPGSSGDMIIDHYARNVLNGYNFDGIRSTGSKVQRAEPAAIAAQSGRVMIVDGCRNKTAFFDELDTFPYARHDDTVDGFSGAFSFFKGKVVSIGPSKLAKGGGSYWRRRSSGIITRA